MPLSTDQMWGLALTQEADDAAALFSHGLGTVRAMTDEYTTTVPALSLLALGAEKLLKLTIGLARRDQGHAWPDKSYMQSTLGHRVAKADCEARQQLGLHDGTAPGWIAQLRARVEGDDVLPVVLNLLETFGGGGRFYFLDLLAEKPQTHLAPQMLWVELMKSVAQARPAILAALVDDNVFDQSVLDRYADARREMNEVVAGSLERWWELYEAAWRTGVIGKEAVHFSSAIKLLHSRQPPWLIHEEPGKTPSQRT